MFPDESKPIGDRPMLVVVDVQNDFLQPDGAIHCPASSVADTETVIENVRKVLAAARESDVPIVWTKEVHRADGADAGLELHSTDGSHTVEGTAGERIHDAFDVDAERMPPGEYLVTKRRYDAFHRTELAHLCATFDVDTVVLVGAATNVCIHYTAQGAHERDLAYRVVEECTAGSNQSLHDGALEAMAYLLPGGVQPLEAVLAALEGYGGNDRVERIKARGTLSG